MNDDITPRVDERIGDLAYGAAATPLRIVLVCETPLGSTCAAWRGMRWRWAMR